jgi:hypothetical protein
VTTRGVIYVHAAPAALTPHLEWAVAGVLDPEDAPEQPGPVRAPVGIPLGAPVERGHGSTFDWIDQHAEPGTMRAEIAWEGPAGTAGRIASALRGWPRLRFEVTEDPSAGNEGERYAWTPNLGMFRATVGVHGDIQVGEDHLRAAIAEAIAIDAPIVDTIEELLGQPWDEELEPFRYAGEGAPVRILHHVI